MSNPFSSYVVIDATKIVRSNIRPDHVREDLKSLSTALNTFKYLRPVNSNEAERFPLSQDIVKKIKAKSDLLDLLKYFGYERDDGEYIYQSAQTRNEREYRRKGAHEIKDLFEDLKSAQDGSLEGFDQFIQNRHPREQPSPSDIDDSVNDSFPSSHEIEEGNAAALALIGSLEDILVREYNKNLPQSVIRQRITRLLYRQIYPESRKVDEDSVDMSINRKVSSLKENDPDRNVPGRNHVHIECLIRTRFNETEALKMLRDNPPNLEVSIEPAVPQNSTTASLDNIMEPLKQQSRLLNQHDNTNGLARQLSRPGDRWENAKHIVQAIQQLRQKGNEATADDAIFSRICRLLYSELLPILGPQFLVKIDLFAREICDEPVDRIENLDIGTIKNILSSNSGPQIRDNFLENTTSLLSMQCPICLTSFPRNQMETMYLCNHQCCLVCLKDYYRNAINYIQGNASLNTLTCFDTPHPITSDVHHNFFVHIEAKFNQWFFDEPDVLQKYHDKLFEATRTTQVKRCGNLTCISSLYVDENDNVARVRCPHCEFAQCGQCCRKWHDDHKGMTCDDYAEWLIDNDPDDPARQLMNYLGSNVIVCPGCEEIFEYQSEGSEHFTCNSCQADFCRICSEFLYSPNKARKCPHNNCLLKTGFHGHCKLNCYQEIRDGTIDAMLELLEENNIDASQGLQQKPVSPNGRCVTDCCGRPTIAESEHRLCEPCYKKFLCSLIWNHHLEPWELYMENNLHHILAKAGIPIPARATKQNLIQLCRQHLNNSLGRPKKILIPRM